MGTAITLVGLVIAVVSLWFAFISVQERQLDRRRIKHRRVRDRLRSAHSTLALAALEDVPANLRLPGVPLIGRESWLISPCSLDDVELVWVDERWSTGEVALTTVFERLELNTSPSYSNAIMQLEEPRDLFNGRIFRLLDATKTSTGLRLICGTALYFDYLDTSEVLAYETCRSIMAGKSALSGRYRRGLDPLNFSNRVASLGVCVLTLVRSRQGETTLILHLRNGNSIAHNPHRIGVTPAGEFAPSAISLQDQKDDFDIWRTIMREFAEEFLGHDEPQRQGGRSINYETDSPYRELAAARAAESLTMTVFGLAVDPLTYKPDLLIVCVIERTAFDSIFGDIVSRNVEGEMVIGHGVGTPFTSTTVADHIADESTTPVAKALLSMAWAHRAELRLGETR